MTTRKKGSLPPPSWTDRFTQGISRETLAAHPWLKPVAHHLSEPGLWHVQHEAGFDVMGWLERFGWPAVLGMAIFAVVGSAGGYVLVNLIWRFRVWFKRRVQRHGR